MVSELQLKFNTVKGKGHSSVISVAIYPGVA